VKLRLREEVNLVGNHEWFEAQHQVKQIRILSCDKITKGTIDTVMGTVAEEIQVKACTSDKTASKDATCASLGEDHERW
jgi:hypothetical protein